MSASFFTVPGMNTKDAGQVVRPPAAASRRADRPAAHAQAHPLERRRSDVHRRARDAGSRRSTGSGRWSTTPSERIATLGGSPNGLPGNLVEARSWDDYSLGRATVLEHLGALDQAYTGVVAEHRAAIDTVEDLDKVTQDMLIGQSEHLERYHWFVRAHLENAGGHLSTEGSTGEKAAAKAAAKKTSVEAAGVMTHVGLHALERGAPTGRPGAPGRAGRAGRASTSCPSRTTSTPGSTSRATARSSGRSSAGWPRRPTGSRRDRRDLPDPAHPPGHRRPCGSHDSPAVRGPLLPGRRHRRGPERARARAAVAVDRGPTGDAGRGPPRHAGAVEGRGRRPPRDALHRGERPPVRRARRSDPRRGVGVRDQGRRAGRPRRGRDLDDVAAGRRPASLPDASGTGPRIGQYTLCWAPTEAEGVATAQRVWPNTGLPGQLAQDLPTPSHFEQARSLVR